MFLCSLDSEEVLKFALGFISEKNLAENSRSILAKAFVQGILFRPLTEVLKIKKSGKHGVTQSYAKINILLIFPYSLLQDFD